VSGNSQRRLNNAGASSNAHAVALAMHTSRANGGHVPPQSNATSTSTTSTYMVPTMQLPTAGASEDKLIDFMCNQLDRILQRPDNFATGSALSVLELLGNGPRDRITGGVSLFRYR
jgi:hypothetical protein